MNALPFGATGSVAGFLRVSTSLFFIMSVGMGIWTSAFLDDYPTLASDLMTDSTDKAFCFVLDLLGIDFARDGKKWTAFGKEMKALGIVFDLSNCVKGSFTIRHTPERRVELLNTLHGVLERGTLSPKEAERARGSAALV